MDKLTISCNNAVTESYYASKGVLDDVLLCEITLCSPEGRTQSSLEMISNLKTHLDTANKIMDLPFPDNYYIPINVWYSLLKDPEAQENTQLKTYVDVFVTGQMAAKDIQAFHISRTYRFADTNKNYTEFVVVTAKGVTKNITWPGKK